MILESRSIIFSDEELVLAMRPVLEGRGMNANLPLKEIVSALDEDGEVMFYWNVKGVVASISVYGDGTYSYFADNGAFEAQSDLEDVHAALPINIVKALTVEAATYDHGYTASAA